MTDRVTLSKRQFDMLDELRRADTVYMYGPDKWTPDMRYTNWSGEHYVHATIARKLIEKGFLVMGPKGLQRREVSVK